MKYWWLEKYRNFKIVQLPDLIEDVNYFIILPKNYEKKYLTIENEDISNLEEEDLLILLKKLTTTKKINNNKLNLIIEKLLTYPDNSFPASDYNLTEMLEEIEKLYKNLPTKDKLLNNNIAICYHCENIFYIDKIKNVNKLGLCLCPYCGSNKLYFDNDYVPMNYTFIKLAHLYYHISNLGCSFIEIQKILKKNIKVSLEKSNEEMIDLTEIFSEKLTPFYEKELSKKIYDELIKQDKLYNRKITIYVDDINMNTSNKLILLLISLMEVLSSTVYLKEIIFQTNSKKVEMCFKSLLKTIITYNIN